MTKKHPLFIIIFFIAFNCSSQSIATALNHDRKPDIRIKPNVVEITTTTTYYRKKGTERLKTTSIYNSRNMLPSEIRYDKDL